MRYKTLFLIFILFLIGRQVMAQKSVDHKTTAWQNPVWNHDFPDPTVIRSPDGNYYAYGTQGGYQGHYARIQVMQSTDRIHWNWKGEALPEKPAWSSKSKNFWAPHVIYDSTHQRYILYYSAQTNSDSLGMAIGVALSKNPEGPFQNVEKPLVSGKGFEAIDPMVFTDPKSGKKYLYWGSDSKPIKVRALDKNGLKFAKDSKEKVALYPDKDHDYDKLIEGPWVIFHQDYYYLFYSGDNCCGDQAHYAVMVARSKNPEGPFIRYSEANNTKSSVILQANPHWMAPGHNSVVKDSKGHLWMYYHAIPKKKYDHNRFGRFMLRDLITFKNGWPRIENGSPSYAIQQKDTFTNPLLPSGADPWVIYHHGYYYYMQTTGGRLVLWKTKNMANLQTAQKKTIWIPPKNTMYSKEIWAPEIHFIEGKWYVYFAADDGQNKNHRMYVIENKAPDPMNGEWTFKGKISDSSDKWAIDASVFEYKDQWYMIWSGWQGDKNGQQNIYIAKMKNPWTISGKRVKISSPDQPWERHGSLPGQHPDHVYVNEGPEILKLKGEVFLIYSANGCWTDYYSLGMLTLINKENLLDPDSWEKSSHPVFKGSKENEVFSPGHNSFFTSPDSSEYWILYHASSAPGQGCGSFRSPRMQRFYWKKNGEPDFGIPVKTNTPIPFPSDIQK